MRGNRELAKIGVRVIGVGENDYPEYLKEIDVRPKKLFVRGNISDLGRKVIAIVGTRRPSAYGREMTARLTRELVNEGYVIVSGLARGIDSVAHRETLRSRGRTIAILGNSIDRIYPPENFLLAEEIIQSGGAVISEIGPYEKVNRGSFPARNRIVSGMSLGVLVVEGARKSGTKITAGFALDQGREVFAVPGRIDNPMSEGPIELIKLGAKAVTSVGDILEELHF